MYTKKLSRRPEGSRTIFSRGVISRPEHFYEVKCEGSTNYDDMADINLLQNQLKDTTSVSTRRTQTVVVIFSFLLILIVAAIAGLYFLTDRIRTETAELKVSNDQLQQQVTNEPQAVGEARTYQAQLSNLQTLLKNHIFISPLLEELGNFTYQRAHYLSFSVKQETGKIHIEGVVENYQGLGKLLLGLSTSPNFSNVKLLSVLPSTSEIAGYRFSIDLEVNRDIFINEP